MAKKNIISNILGFIGKKTGFTSAYQNAYGVDGVSGAAVKPKPVYSKPIGPVQKPTVVKVGMTPPSPTNKYTAPKVTAKPKPKVVNPVAKKAATALLGKKTGNNQNPTSSANQVKPVNNAAVKFPAQYNNGTYPMGATALAPGEKGYVPPTDNSGINWPSQYNNGTYPMGATELPPGDKGYVPPVQPQTPGSIAGALGAVTGAANSGTPKSNPLLDGLAKLIQAGSNTAQDPSGMKPYLDEVGANGAYGMLDNAPVLSTADYVKQAIEQLAPGLLAKLGGYKTQLDNTMVGYDADAGSVNQNAAGSIADNTRSTNANINQFSNASLSRGLGRSSIATTGMGELGVIGQRHEGEIKASRDAALANISALKANAGREYETNVATANASNVAEANSMGNELHNNAVDKNLKIGEYNNNQKTAKQNAALELKSSRESAAAKAASDKADRDFNDKQLAAQIKKDDDAKVIKQQEVDIKKANELADEAKAKYQQLKDSNAAAAKVAAAKKAAEVAAAAAKKKADAAAKLKADELAAKKKADALKAEVTKRGQNIGLTKTQITTNAANKRAADALAVKKAAAVAKTNKASAPKPLPEMSASDYTKARDYITSVISKPETPGNKADRDAAIKRLIAKYSGAQDGPKKQALLKMLGVK